MKNSELRTQDEAEFQFLLKEKRKRIFDLRFKASEELADTKEVRRLRREIARILTIQNERKRAAAQGAPRTTEGKADVRS